MDAASSIIKVTDTRYDPNIFDSTRFQSKSVRGSYSPWHPRLQHDVFKEDTGLYPQRDSFNLVHKEGHHHQDDHDHTRGSLRLKLLWAILIFVSTLLVAHSMRDRIRLYAGSASGEVKWVGPVVRKQLHSSYTYVETFARRHLTEPGRNLLTSPSTSNVNELAVALSADDSQPTSPHKKPENVAFCERDEKPNVAILRHSREPIALRDLALNTEYIAELTSHTDTTLDHRQKQGLHVLSWVLGFEFGRHLGQSPTMALRDGGSDEQSCWMFPGPHGHIGIRLKERISVEKFTVDHFPRDMLSDFAILQAPRKMILWGRVEGPHNLSKEKIYREYMENGLVSRLSSESQFLSSANGGEHYIPLGYFEYKLSGQPQSHIQTKEVPQALQSLQMDFGVVVLEILSNWGASSTCLYRVRVHGSSLKGIALHTAPLRVV